jgi:glycosyl-4,4'-diaponeurosporenoate acyltransferase
MLTKLIAINAASWLVLQLSIAWGVTLLNSNLFASDNLLYRLREWETGFYRRWLSIRRWKRLLPDGGPWVGSSFRKKRMASRDFTYLRQFTIETRRSEMAHWLMLACAPLFCLWNPPRAWAVTALYAIAANVPCIVVQRYNRDAIGGVLARRDRLSPFGRSDAVATAVGE